ncbi:hypothetical protein HPB50_014689 [Hyalomma asiaticum]|uniref:Uncharacterized protein n=1 Tax=Hyalomma asiaticum TaxID=266040 RepID=A0ACB7T0I5_HYAAI|nr:hypothetical protein HPB50_014689 [Hyalomma asiaticum]
MEKHARCPLFLDPPRSTRPCRARCRAVPDRIGNSRHWLGREEKATSGDDDEDALLNVRAIVSKASIAGGPTLYLNSGSTLNLTCEVMESPVPPDYVFWYHDARVINYDIQHGVSVQTEKSPRTQSRLLIANAQPHDSGNYSCVPSNAEPASIVVHVLNGEQPALITAEADPQEHEDENESSTVADVPRSAPRRNETAAVHEWDACEFLRKLGQYLTSMGGLFVF